MSKESDIMNYNRDYQNREWLEEEYTKKGKIIKEIAKECGVRASTISRHIKKYGIGCSRSKRVHSKYRDKKWLYEQYVTLNKSMPQIARECNCYPLTITRWLTKYKITKYGNRKKLIEAANNIIYKNNRGLI